VNETSRAHVWRLRSRYLGMGYDKKDWAGNEFRQPQLHTNSFRQVPLKA
jgi:hypothetical protein